MSRMFFPLDSFPTILIGTATVTAIVISQSPMVIAKTSQEIAQIAIPTTVQINNTLGVPGGSGVLIAKQGNTYTVLTANHVVANPNFKYVIRTHIGKDYPVTAVQNLQLTPSAPDLAIVKFESPENYLLATLGNSKQALVGADIYVSGYPLAVGTGSERNHEFTTGIVTSRPDSRLQGYTMRYQALTRRGMSGGPVFDIGGRVVGIHGQGDTVGTVKNESVGRWEEIKTGFNAAIPIDTFMGLISQAGLNRSDLLVDNSSADRRPDNNSNQARKDLVEGLAQVERGQISQANQSFNQALQRNPNDPRAYLYRGLTRYRSREWQAAIDDLTQALGLEPNIAEAYFLRGLTYYRLGNKQKALSDYTQALHINSVYGSAYLNRGVVHEDLGDRQGALADYNRAIQVAPNYGMAYHNRGVIRYYLRDKQGAIEDLQRASELCFEQGNKECYETAINNLNRIQ